MKKLLRYQGNILTIMHWTLKCTQVFCTPGLAMFAFEWNSSFKYDC